MYEWLWLAGLCLSLLMLFLLALLKPALKNPKRRIPQTPIAASGSVHTQKLYNMLAPSLSEYTLTQKANRVLISDDNGEQIAIITLDDHAVMHERLLAGALILTLPTRFRADDAANIITKVRQHAADRKP